jgi:hypothetical protein
MSYDELTYEAKQRLKSTEENITLIVTLMGVIVFICGMIIGSVLHDPIFHKLEHPIMKVVK